MFNLINQLNSLLGQHDMVSELKLAKITMIGSIHTYVENHRGIVLFTPTQIQLKAPHGLIEITGEKLMINRLQKDEIIVEGDVHSIHLTSENRGDKRFDH